MLTCLPQSICSWNFRVDGCTAGPASIQLGMMSTSGVIRLAHVEYAVKRHGVLFGNWTLEHNGNVIATAEYPTAFFTSFSITLGDVVLKAKRAAFFNRNYELTIDGRTVGTVERMHVFTRRAWIKCDPAVSELLQLFAFWMIAQAWRREQRSS